MHRSISRQVALIAGAALWSPTQAQSHSCYAPIPPFLGSIKSEEKEKRLAKYLYTVVGPESDRDILVAGIFKRTDTRPLSYIADHKTLLENYDERGWTETKTLRDISHRYVGAYSFSGHIITEGKKKPFETTATSLTISLFFQYTGVATLPPPTGETVIGTLRHNPRFNHYEISAGLCPSYIPVSNETLDAVLQCITDGECS